MNLDFERPGSSSLSPPPGRKDPQHTVAAIVAWIKAGIVLALWFILVIATLDLTYVAIRGMLFAAHAILKAIGV